VCSERSRCKNAHFFLGSSGDKGCPERIGRRPRPPWLDAARIQRRLICTDVLSLGCAGSVLGSRIAKPGTPYRSYAGLHGFVFGRYLKRPPVTVSEGAFAAPLCIPLPGWTAPTPDTIEHDRGLVAANGVCPWTLWSPGGRYGPVSRAILAGEPMAMKSSRHTCGPASSRS
jgi:hypothetical protein